MGALRTLRVIISTMRNSPAIAQAVQRTPSPGRGVRRKVYGLSLAEVRPVVRIAHHISHRLQIDWRIIVDHELVLILSGRGVFQIGETSFDYQPGSLIMIPPFVPHQFDAPARAASAHIAVHFDYSHQAPPVGEPLQDRQPYEVRMPTQLQMASHMVLPQEDPVRAALARLVELNLADPLDELEASARLTDILLQLWRRNASHTSVADDTDSLAQRNHLRIDRAIRRIESDYHLDLTADALAEAAGMSVSHFNRLFRTATGYAPLEYLRRHRINRARTLLADVDLSIKEIASAVGFTDSFHFSKVFHKIDGLSPTQFRQTVLKRGMIEADIE